MLRNTILLTLALLLGSTGSAAEITLRAKTHASKGVVTLGDVAEIHGADATTLQAIELVPAPSAGRVRSLQMREVQDLLALHGIKLIDHQFSGSTKVQIEAPRAIAANTAPSLKATRSVRDQVTKRAERAIQRHLQQVADERVSWDVQVELSEEHLATLSARNAEIIAAGGEQPWTGKQSFTLQTLTNQGMVRLPVTAVVRLPEMVVVPKRPLRKGEVVRASDVELKMPQEGDDDIALATQVDDIVGRETLRSVATGQPIESAWVRKPIMVRRSEVVTVFARGANLTVRMQGRAIEEGGLNDIVSVERLDDRQRFSARVTGVQELEVLVGGTRVTATKPATR